MLELKHHPTETELNTLMAREEYAVTVYHTFEIIEWRDRWVTMTAALIRNTATEAGWDHKTREQVTELFLQEAEDVRLSKPNVAVFITPHKVHIYNTYTRFTPATKAGHYFDLLQLFRTITNPRDGYTVTVSLDGWDVWKFDGPDAPELLPFNKQDVPDFHSFTNTVVNKHISQRSAQDLRTEHIRRYGKKIADLLKPVIGQKPAILIGDKELIHDVANHLPTTNTWVVDKNPSTVDVEEVSHLYWDTIFQEQLAKELDLVYARTGEGLTVQDLANLGQAAKNSAVDTLYVDINFNPTGTYNTQTGGLSYEGEEPLMTKLIHTILNNGGAVYVIRDNETVNPFWNNQFIATRRWSY